MVLSLRRVEELLHTGKDRGLYDGNNDVKATAMVAIGFYPKYLTYANGQKQRDHHTSRWTSARTVYPDNLALKEHQFWRIVHWTYWPGLAHMRKPTTHARGVFVARHLKVVLIYEPRKLEEEHLEKAKRRWYNLALNQFCKYFGPSYQFVTVFGSQKLTWDCEKRVLRFGMCCLDEVVGLIDRTGLQDIQCKKPRCWLKVSAILPYHVRS